MKFQTLTQRKKNLGLVFCTLLLLILTYSLSIRRTIEMIKSIGVLKEKINQAENASSRIANLQEQIAKWDQSLLTSVSNKAINLRIFDEVSQTSQKLNVQVKGMRCLGSKVEKNIVVDTYEILFSSDYKSLVKVLHHLENNMKYGFVSSATFELMKNQEKQRNDLVLRLFIQTMVNN